MIQTLAPPPRPPSTCQSFDDRGNAVLYPSEEGTHPSGHVDPEAMVGKVSWPARAKGAARKLTQQDE